MYRFTLSEFLNAWKGYTDEKQLDHRVQYEAAQMVLSGLVKKVPKLPWQKEDTEPYTEEEKRAIAAAHDKDKKIIKEQVLTADGWKDVSS